jgi:hypothetical protein
MKWIFLLICFVTTIASGQADENSTLEKLKKTDRLMGRDNYNNSQPKLRTLIPMQSETIQRNHESVITSLQKLKTLTHMQSKIIHRDNERALISLPLDNMSCIVPNMNLFKVMPNAGSLALLEHPTDPGIYLNKPNLKSKK